MFLSIFFITVTLAVSILDLFLSELLFRQKSRMGVYLGITCVSAAVSSIGYLIAVYQMDYRAASMAYSIYFVGIDWMLMSLLLYIVKFTNRGTRKTRNNWEVGLAAFYMVVDNIILLLNPFYETAIHYGFKEAVVGHYVFEMKMPFQMHLIYTYVMVILIVVLLIQKMLRVPKGYRIQYVYILMAIIFIVALNAIFLVSQADGEYAWLDYSVWGYSIGVSLIYWNGFQFSSHGMMNYFRTWIFENINQGLALFDYEDNLIVKNERMEKLMPKTNLEIGISVSAFLEQCGISNYEELKDENYSFQCFINESGYVRPIRCDYRPFANKSGEIMGKLFVFTDASHEVDLLTGFRNWESFKTEINERQGNYTYPMTILVCDIIGLTHINGGLGRDIGDQAIQILADILRKNFPQGSYYVRGREASLIAMTHYIDAEQAQKCLDQIKTDCSHITALGCFLNIQGSVSVATGENMDILEAIEDGFQGLRAKKLLDQKSSHSELIASLTRALQECDSDTEAHVKRTQELGSRLGKRIDLTDVQQSNLSLLCILHDIGKIGIPLEILNKPGKLTEVEWDILHSHVEKGYQIASTSLELRGIADMILHHHERWDGMGYPTGLTKESIPLLSRVIAVVDAFDAMVNDRSYRPALTVEAAKNELKRCAGTQFDPMIVSEFLQMLNEDEEIEEKLLQQIAEDEKENPEEGQPGQEASEVRELGNDLPDITDDLTQSSGRVHQIHYCRYVIDANSRIIMVDDEFERMTGYSKEEVEELQLSQIDLIFEEDRTEYLCLLNELLARNPIGYVEHRVRRKDNSSLFVFCLGRRFYDSAEKAERSEIIIMDITNTYTIRTVLQEEHEKAVNRLIRWEDKYRCDSLTGLLTHEALKNDVEMMLLQGSVKAMMLMMDIDRFKEYNDTYGHRSGDEFLIMVSQVLTGSLRKDDLACRMGGDEFAAVLFYDEHANDQRMLERAQQICDKINMTLAGEKGGTSLSMGTAISGGDLNTFNRLYEAADSALYEAKQAGRSRMEIYKG